MNPGIDVPSVAVGALFQIGQFSGFQVTPIIFAVGSLAGRTRAEQRGESVLIASCEKDFHSGHAQK